MDDERASDNEWTDDEWAGCPHWSMEKEQAAEERRALRALTCPVKGCRRMQRCTRAGLEDQRPCAGLAAYQPTEEERRKDIPKLRFMISRMIEEAETMEEAEQEALYAARNVARKRRRALALERAKAQLGDRRARRPSVRSPGRARAS